MKVRVVGNCHTELVVDIDSPAYKAWRKFWWGRRDTTEAEAIILYARRQFDAQELDDDGHSSISSLSFDWEIKEADNDNR